MNLFQFPTSKLRNDCMSANDWQAIGRVNVAGGFASQRELERACESVAAGAAGFDWSGPCVWDTLSPDRLARLRGVETGARVDRENSLEANEQKFVDAVVEAYRCRNLNLIGDALAEREARWEETWTVYQMAVARAYAAELWAQHEAETMAEVAA